MCRLMYLKGIAALAASLSFPLIAAELNIDEQTPPAREMNVYTHPGIVVSQGGKWIGSDHLLNLTKKIDVVVEILKPEGTRLPFSEESLEKKVEAVFKKKDFDTTASTLSAMPNIPFFNILLVVYPIEKGFVALIDGRLMESIDPKRVKLDKDTDFQAITWEKKTLIVAPTDEFEAVVEKTMEEILKTFFERYEFFEKMKIKMEVKDETQRMKH